MSRAVVYDPASGEILRAVECPPDMLAIQARAGEQLIEGDADDNSHFVLAGALVAYTPEQKESKKYRPAWAGAWSNASMSWTDPRDLTQRKADKWAEIKAERDRLEAAGFPYLGTRFDADPRSVLRIVSAVQAAQAAAGTGKPFTVAWTGQNNRAVPMNAAALAGMSVALATFADELHQSARALREQIESATTAEQIEEIRWSAT
ncbi:MAG: DUF4376 domain-containing protein [Methylibium sp.]|nr:DUF4376 domain-containing protein [Methylibium sp.]